MRQIHNGRLHTNKALNQGKRPKQLNDAIDIALAVSIVLMIIAMALIIINH